MKKFETTKLFYNEYENKLVIRNQLAHLFRDKQWGYTKNHLDRLQYAFECGSRLEYIRGRRVEVIDVQDFREAQILFNELTNSSEYKLRVESPRMQIYSNNLNLLDRLSAKIASVLERWEPGDAGLVSADTVILNRARPYDYRITLANSVTTDFANWVDSNLDKIKIGMSCLSAIRHRRYTRGLYFYVRNEKYLHLLQLVGSDCILKIDKVIYKQKLDK